MNMISHLIEKYIDDDEQKLALKISISSFVIFTTILTLIIWTSYVYQRNNEYHDFMTEKQFIDTRDVAPPMIISESIDAHWGRAKKWQKWPRDVIVFDEDRQVIKNDFFDLSPLDIDYLYSVRNAQNTSVEFMWRIYLISKTELDNSTTFLFHDLTPIRDFHITLLIIALLGSLIGLTIIYLLARYLAHITITPIREQARELEAYSHNVAHELRTPLSVMRSNLELLRMKPEDRFIDSTDEEITGMERIIESLLFLAKPDGIDTHKDMDITIKTSEIISKYTPETSIIFTHDKKHIHKEINEELYSRILCNLIENAIKYRSDWDISIDLTKKGIKISNQIDHEMSIEEQSNLTKVFYQWDTSRNSTGYGLGLALVAKIVEISGWSIDIATRDRVFVVEIAF